MHKQLSKLFGLSLLCLVSMVLAFTFGAIDISNQALIECLFSQCENSITETVVWQIRMPRILVAVVAGMGLAIAGALLQNITANPLADPYLFGIVSGAGLGATIASITLANQISLSLPIAAFLGALLAISLVVLIAKVLNRIEQLLLAGVAVSFMLAAISQFILYLGEPFAANRVLFWLMGSLARVEMDNFYLIALVLSATLLIIFAYHRQIDALLLGDENAASLGVNVSRLRFIMLILCAAITATIVAYCGGIGFVGLMIPHIVRQFLGVTTLPLILGSALLGASFLIWVDVIAKTSLPESEIPLGIITSAVGSAFFLIIMYQTRHRN